MRFTVKLFLEHPTVKYSTFTGYKIVQIDIQQQQLYETEYVIPAADQSLRCPPEEAVAPCYAIHRVHCEGSN